MPTSANAPGSSVGSCSTSCAIRPNAPPKIPPMTSKKCRAQKACRHPHERGMKQRATDDAKVERRLVPAQEPEDSSLPVPAFCEPFQKDRPHRQGNMQSVSLEIKPIYEW